MEFKPADKENLWLVVPKKVAFEYIKPEEYRQRMKKLFDEGKYVLIYDKDRGLIRRLRIWKNMHRHYKNFATYMPK